jgi:hypothetical protein
MSISFFILQGSQKVLNSNCLSLTYHQRSVLKEVGGGAFRQHGGAIRSCDGCWWITFSEKLNDLIKFL